jgi:hypothetical protein
MSRMEIPMVDVLREAATVDDMTFRIQRDRCAVPRFERTVCTMIACALCSLI